MGRAFLGRVASFPRSAWECLPGRSASRAGPVIRLAEPATRSVPAVRSHAERGNEGGWTRPGFMLLLALLAACALPGTPARGAVVSFGDIAVITEPEPKGTHNHGYAEYLITVRNNSQRAGHRVRLTLPRNSFSSPID